ncbi:MAG: signal peptidase I [Spirochaetes bacterium]|nr:signal peptidase I [Spirochaetota bacterium]
MKRGIIISEAGLDRNPALAFVLSFFFTGLGQIYNGDLAKGFVFFILRIFTIIFPAAVIIFKNLDSYILYFAASFVLNALVWLLSAVDAMYAARRLTDINLKKYNSPVFYIPYSIINIILVLLSLFLIFQFVSIKKISNDEMNPSFFKGEYMLINKYSRSGLDVGDVIYYSDAQTDRAGRIIARGGEEYRYEESRFYINNAELPLGILNADEMGSLGLDSSEELFYETNGRRRYPVKVFFENNPYKENKPAKKAVRYKESLQIKNNELLVSYDNRSSGNPALIVGKDVIKGRVEGVFFAFNLRRLFLKSYLNN